MDDAYQILSVSSDQCLKILTLNKKFVSEFVDTPILCLAESLSRATNEEQTQHDNPPEQITVLDDGDYTQLQRSRIEIENLKALSYVQGLVIEEVAKVEDSERLTDNNTQINLQLRLNIKNAFLSMYVVLPPDYPNELPKFRIGESFMLPAQTIKTLQSLLQKIPAQNTLKGFSLVKVLEFVYYMVQGEMQHLSVLYLLALLGLEQTPEQVPSSDSSSDSNSLF